jgi:cell division protein ZapA
MPLVNVLINGRAYTVACDEGEEEHLRQLSQFLDKRVRELAASVGQVGDARLLLMAGLLISDELSDLRSRLDAMEKELAVLKARAKRSTRVSDEVLAETLEEASARLEAVATRLNGA